MFQGVAETGIQKLNYCKINPCVKEGRVFQFKELHIMVKDIFCIPCMYWSQQFQWLKCWKIFLVFCMSGYRRDNGISSVPKNSKVHLVWVLTTKEGEFERIFEKLCAYVI